MSGDLLGLTASNPSSQGSYSTTTTFADIGIQCSFVAPASGSVLVRLTAFAQNNAVDEDANMYWGIREGGSTVKGPRLVANGNPSGSAQGWGRTFLITGLTPGSNHTYKWAAQHVEGGGHHGPWVIAWGGDGGGGGSNLGHAVMEVWDAASFLGLTHYDPGSAVAYNTGTSVADIDATNLKVTFTAPDSGAVLVRLTCTAYPTGTTGELYWGLREGGALVAGMAEVGSGRPFIASQVIAKTFLIDGLSPGSVHTYKWAAKHVTDDWFVRYGGGDLDFGGATMEVSDALPPVPAVPIAWDAYAANEPNGDILATIQNDFAPVSGATGRSVRIELNGPGAGTFKINRYSSVATEAVLSEGNLIKCRWPWRPDYDFAFILEKGDFLLAHQKEKGGEEFTFGGRGVLAYLDRAVMDAVAYTTGLDTSDTWTEIWNTNVVPRPVGTAFDSAQSAYLFALSASTRRIYKIRQSDRHVVATSPALFSGTGAGLSGDPSDSTIWWVLEAPWLSGSSANTRIHKVRKSDYAILDTFDLGSALQYTAIKASASFLWLSRWDGTATISKRSKVDGSSVATYTITYGGVTQVNMTGISVNGTKLAYWYDGTKRALIADVSAPTTITDKISTQSIASFGGDWSTESGQDYFYMDSSTVGLIWKYQITSAVPHDPIDGIWRLDEGSPGAILWRVLQEAQAAGRPQQPLPDLTYGFTATVDSNGNTWDAHDGTTEFDARITESVLSVALRLLPYGLIEQMSPYLVLGAYNASAYGVDRTGDFAPGVVRFEKGVNIIPELGRQMRERPLHSHMLAVGSNSLYARAVLNDLGYVREGGITTQIEDETALEGQAEATLADERVKSERIRFAIPIGDDEANGKYLPFTHYNVGDLVTVHTGTGEHDFDTETFVLYAFTLEESVAGKWEKAVIEVGSATIADDADNPLSSGGATGTGGGGGGGGVTLTPPSPITVEGIDETGTTLTTAIGTKIRVLGGQVYQEAAGIIRLIVQAANRLLNLDDVDAGDITDGQTLVWDEASGTFVPADMAGGSGSGDVFDRENQIVQAGMFLDRMGQWRNPNVRGTGDLAVAASAAEVFNHSAYDAWFSGARLLDGRPIACWTHGSTHHGDNTGKAVAAIGAWLPDGTIDWTAYGGEFTVYDDASFWYSGVGVSVLSTGRVIFSMFGGDFDDPGANEAAVIWSDDMHELDSSATFSAKVTVNAPTLDSFQYGSGRVLELPYRGDDQNGPNVLLQCVEGKASGDTKSRMMACLSYDGGGTWPDEISIAGTGADRDFFEGCPLLVAYGTEVRIHVFLRTTECDPGEIYQVRATVTPDIADLTFGTPAFAFAGYGQPNNIQASWGTIYVGTRLDVDGTCEKGKSGIYASIDGGDNWSAALVFYDGAYDTTYTGLIESDVPGRVAVLTGKQPTSSISDCRFWQGFISEDLVSSAGPVAAEDVTIEDVADNFTATDVEGALAELATRISGGIGEILISDSPSTPLVFADLIQNEAEDDLVYGDP